ncbi:MAG: N-acetylmuramoyl-L-alanine amidase [Actinomycetota bacterium]|nr:N-acetylmuramoyl-L-alanine amidase [Actinomycetota bacterium]
MHTPQALLVSAALAASLLVLAPTGTSDTTSPTATDPRTAAPVRLLTPAAARPVTPQVREFLLRPAAASAGAVTSRPAPSSGFGVVGATWDGLAPPSLRIAVRTRSAQRWSAWTPLAVDADHAPDPGTTEARADRQGTDPLVVGDVDLVQLRAASRSGRLPADLRLSVVDPGRSAADDDTVTAATAAVPVGQARRPVIRSRGAWGANERLRKRRPTFGVVRAGFVHHTVNSNGYSRADVPAIIRGIYAFHTQGRGWSDIGYNFLVDRFGRIWEGRFGGVRRNVIGAHTLGYNHLSFAMSAIGNFQTAGPSRAVLRAYGRLMAWKLGINGVAAGDMRQRLRGRVLRAISGHRDAGQTACPGIRLYRRIPAIRGLAVDAQRGGRPPAPPPAPTPPPAPPPPPPTDDGGPGPG